MFFHSGLPDDRSDHMSISIVLDGSFSVDDQGNDICRQVSHTISY